MQRASRKSSLWRSTLAPSSGPPSTSEAACHPFRPADLRTDCAFCVSRSCRECLPERVLSDLRRRESAAGRVPHLRSRAAGLSERHRESRVRVLFLCERVAGLRGGDRGADGSAILTRTEEMVKGDDQLTGLRPLVWPDTDSVHLAGQPMRPGFGADTAHTNDRLETPRSDLAHAI